MKKQSNKHKKAVAILMMGFLGLSACNLNDLYSQVPGSAPTDSTGSSTTPPAPSSGGETANGPLNVVIHQATNYSEAGLALLESARALLEKIVNSEAFKQRILDFTYNGQQAFVQNNGYTNQQIYDLIQQGAEQLPQVTSADQTMDFIVERYTSSYFGRNVVGYTNAGDPTIYMNSYFFDSAEARGVAANMMHEWMHKLGFEHDYYSTAQRPYSVPYAVGTIVEEVAATL